MKFTALRQYIKANNPSSPHVLMNCDLVIDGDSYFKDTYRASGCQFILGADCDRYAKFITGNLRIFLDSKINCHVIFSGATKHEIEKRKEIHQSIIDKLNNNEQHLDNAAYIQPLFVEDVQKEVLKEMDIKYFVCEYDSIEAIVGVARKLKCPVLTNNVEYTLFGVSCIPPNTVEHEKTDTKLKCSIYEHEAVKTAFGVYGKMPILLTLLNESGHCIKLTEIIQNEQSDAVLPVIRLVKRQREAVLISTISSFGDQDRNKAFNEAYEKIKTLYLYPTCNLAVKYFQRDNPHGLFRDDKKWFAKGVSNGRIAPSFINLKNRKVICGSTLMNNSNQPDALLAALDIIVYSHCLLTNSQSSTITFLERKCNSSSIRKIATHWDKEISNRGIFTEHRVGKKLKLKTGEDDVFTKFLKEILPGFDDNEILLTVPKDCWILIITLVYYVFKKNQNFVHGAYCVLLSYFMLGPVSKTLNHFKKDFPSLLVSNKSSFYNSLQFLFNNVDVKQKYNSTIVHNFSEFQHCLQHMNYLNKLCGEKIPCTVYHSTYNATFIYNTFFLMKDKDCLMRYLENNFMGSNSLKTYKDIVSCFENCLSAVKLFAKTNR